MNLCCMILKKPQHSVKNNKVAHAMIIGLPGIFCEERTNDSLQGQMPIIERLIRPASHPQSMR